MEVDRKNLELLNDSRKIKLINIFVFITFFSISACIAGMIFKFFQFFVGKSYFRIFILWIFSSFSFFCFFYMFYLFYYCCILKLIKLKEEEISIKERKKWFKIFYKIVIDSIVINMFFPIICNFPFILKIMGAKIEKNIVIAGKIFHPDMIEIGNNVIIGMDSLIVPHLISKGKIFFKKIKIGNNCTIGVKTVIFPGVVLEDNVTVVSGVVIGPNVVVPKNTVVWKDKFKNKE
jgi:acetyltransferase-like isoleucine patch superfamily enzyme